MSMPKTVVFDAEPLVAHADDERGGSTVATYLGAVGRDEAAGYCNWVNVSELRYILARKYDRTTADTYIEWLWELGLEPVDIEPVWTEASEYVLSHNPALGDSFALATAAHLGGTLLVGGDDGYDDVTDVPLIRFREGSD